MDFKDIEEELEIFLKERGWIDFSPNDVFIHLIEELGEIGKHLLFQSKYKTENMGHERPPQDQLSREFGQSFSLFLQLAIILGVNLEESWKNEFEIMKKRFPLTDKIK